MSVSNLYVPQIGHPTPQSVGSALVTRGTGAPGSQTPITDFYVDETTGDLYVNQNLSAGAWLLNGSGTGGAVTSVFSRTGTITATSGDYTTTLVTEGTNLYFTNARARSAVSSGSSLISYNSSTGVFTLGTITVAGGGTGTTTARAVGANIGIYMLSVAGGGNGDTDYIGKSAAFEGQLGLAYYGSKAMFVYVSGSTTAGDWLHSFVFPTGISNIGDSTKMDSGASTQLGIHFNGHTAGHTAAGDQGVFVYCWSLNSKNSGASLGLAVNDGTDDGTGKPGNTVNGGKGAIQWVHTAKNRVSGLIPAWTYFIATADNTHVKGYAISAVGHSTDSGNFSYYMADFKNHLIRFPKHVIGVYQPDDTFYTFTISGVTTHPVVGDQYTNNGTTYTVASSSGTTFKATGQGTPSASGTLTRVNGSGDATISFSSIATTGIWADSFSIDPDTAISTFWGTMQVKNPGGGSASFSVDISGNVGLSGSITQNNGSGVVFNFYGSDGGAIAIDCGGTTSIYFSKNNGISLLQAGLGLAIKEGSNAKMGVATLSGGTVTVSTTKVTANSRIFISVNGVGTLANFGPVYEDQPNRTAGTSFILKSSNVLSNATVIWMIVEPA